MQTQEITFVIERIQQMEQYYDAVLQEVEKNVNELYGNAEINKMIQELNEYMDSGLWLKDYERDERGELPKGLKRGVLSEDGLYNLLVTVHTSMSFS